MPLIVGIIGGTGLDQDTRIFKDYKIIQLEETPFGWASDHHAASGSIEGVQVYLLSRHGNQHDVNPSHVNYRANLWTLVNQLECTHVLVTSACGSLKEHIGPGDLGIMDQYVDRTCHFRDRSFYKVCHIEQRKPINSTMQRFIKEACDEENLKCHENLTVVTIEGPRFSTMAESKLHRSWGCDVVNMTSVPEVPLASELATCYASILLVTDHDCWKDDDDGAVSNDQVLERMIDLSAKVRLIIPRIIRKIAAHDWTEQFATNKKVLNGSIMVE